MTVEQSIYFAIWTFNALYNILILKREISKRLNHAKSGDKTPLFQSKSLSIFSLLTLICATLWPIANIMQRVHYVCLYATEIAYILAASASTFFNYYQYARLYYCFSSNKTHSTKGYQNHVFIMLYTLSAVVYLWRAVSI